jgi:hypothetical protein
MQGASDFDFLIGDWRVHHRRLKERLANSQEWIEFDGTALPARSSAVSATWTKIFSICRIAHIPL